MRQYQKVKAKYPDAILLFRMGDFYETFEEDARIASRVLGITLTKRGNGAAGEVPLAGFPHHALDSYLPKLLKAGHRVAVCEQLEDPKFAKGIVKRDVIEVVTPGVAFSEKVLEQRQNNYLASVALPTALATGSEPVGLAFIDVSTGEFSAGEVSLKEIADQISVLQPSEVLIQKRDVETVSRLLKDKYKGLFSKIDDWVFAFDFGYESLTRQFQTQSLKGFGLEELKMAVVAAGAIMYYLQETQKANLPHIRKIIPYDVSDSILLDASTKRNLEITTTTQGQSEGSLFSVIDRTLTPMGGRLLKKWINLPLKRIEPIRHRLAAVTEMTEHEDAQGDLSAELKLMGDLERLVSRIATGRANPRELNQLRDSLARVPAIVLHLKPFSCQVISSLRAGLDPLPEVQTLISTALEEDPPLALADGGVIRKGYNNELDELRQLAFHGKDWIARLQEQERKRTGISSLKVGFNNVFGYYLEVTHTHKDKVPSDYTRKQTLTNAERFITPELKEYEEKILNAEEKIIALETRLYDEVRREVGARCEEVQSNARRLAELDCFLSLAGVAADFRYTCPEVDESRAIEIRQGRHPVIERVLPPGEQYTPNDAFLNAEGEQILIVTGPNMSGKSSYLRQVGLITLLAQIGSFVPAESARIGIVDRIFTRVGASDNISSGESTFLVEMHEAAAIVNTATDRSLILLDEVGRGTSTFDGISIAWALTEYLHERIGARTLFATHYHELNELAEFYARIKNYKVDVREYGGKVIFLHKVVEGFADHSYGIHVAQLAGLPEEVTQRAASILRNLEGSELSARGTGHAEKRRVRGGDLQMTLFEVKDEALRERIKNLEPETMTPLEALQKLAELKKSVEDPNS
ncbi:MAG: DNA mismatch repair protein MutS [Ignavibacteriales bacterium]|nr:DNA mismatch repair protein MutS [Ignavibacteriales bacterium]